MTRLRATFPLAVFFMAMGFSAAAQQLGEEANIISGDGFYSFGAHEATFTNNVVIKFKGAVLTADRAVINEDSGETVADGHVRIQQDNQLWAGEHIRYNYKTHQMVSEEPFRTGKSPTFAAGRGLQGDLTNHVYNATNGLITADDVADPAIKIRAKQITIIPGVRIEATHATLWLGDVPVFYFPYYQRSLEPHANHFNVTPGYGNRNGPFLLGNYTWWWNNQLDGELHLDYREQRGIGVGPEFNYHLGRWGDGTIKYYYTHDRDPGTNAALNAPVFENRQRVYFDYQANPYTNFNVKSLVRYQSDIGVIHDFFEGEYRKDPEPNTFVEANKFWQNFSLDVLTQPRINDFYETVERLPDVRLTGFRQQLGATPFYYESESTAGYYRRLFAETNSAPPGLNFEAGRADTYHQITLPETFFGWLNVAPRAGGRFTYYSASSGPAGTNDAAYRGVFNTGAEITFKASQLWPDVRNHLLDLDGVRHIIEPSVNYVFVPKPNDTPNELPQFDYQLPSLRQLPIEFPEYNSIDSIDSQNVLRFGLQNKVLTKRAGQVEDFLNSEVFLDWRLHPRGDQETFGDIFSDLTLRPRSWLSLQSQTRFDINDENWNMLLHTLTIQPNNVWGWTIGHFYLRNDINNSPTALGQGNNIVSSSVYYRVNENWGLRATHHFDLIDGRLQEQTYTIYRDLRSWTAALSAGLRNNEGQKNDFTIAFTFSLKSSPHFGLGSDTVQAYSLLGR